MILISFQTGHKVITIIMSLSKQYVSLCRKASVRKKWHFPKNLHFVKTIHFAKNLHYAKKRHLLKNSFT